MCDRVLDRIPWLPLVGSPAIRRQACAKLKPAGQVAILVIDIVGSTELARELGDDRFVDVVVRHHEVVRLEAERGRALSIKPQGDGVFLVFASADDALAAAQAIQRAFIDWPVATRAAVHAGPAIAADGEYYGLALNLAAHIADLATGGQVLVSEATIAAAAAAFRFGPPHDVWVQGACVPERLRDLLWR